MYTGYERIDETTVVYTTDKDEEITYKINSDTDELALLSIILTDNYIPYMQQKLWELYGQKELLNYERRPSINRYMLHKNYLKRIKFQIEEINRAYKIIGDTKKRINFTEVKRIDKNKIRKI